MNKELRLFHSSAKKLDPPVRSHPDRGLVVLVNADFDRLPTDMSERYRGKTSVRALGDTLEDLTDLVEPEEMEPEPIRSQALKAIEFSHRR